MYVFILCVLVFIVTTRSCGCTTTPNLVALAVCGKSSDWSGKVKPPIKNTSILRYVTRARYPKYPIFVDYNV